MKRRSYGSKGSKGATIEVPEGPKVRIVCMCQTSRCFVHLRLTLPHFPPPSSSIPHITTTPRRTTPTLSLGFLLLSILRVLYRWPAMLRSVWWLRRPYSHFILPRRRRITPTGKLETWHLDGQSFRMPCHANGNLNRMDS